VQWGYCVSCSRIRQKKGKKGVKQKAVTSLSVGGEAQAEVQKRKKRKKIPFFRDLNQGGKKHTKKKKKTTLVLRKNREQKNRKAKTVATGGGLGPTEKKREGVPSGVLEKKRQGRWEGVEKHFGERRESQIRKKKARTRPLKRPG